MNERLTAFEQEIKEISEAIITQMKVTDGNWMMPWHKGLEPARNAKTGHLYSGSNFWKLWLECEVKSYNHNVWATLKQWAQLKAKVRKSEKGTMLFQPILRNRLSKKKDIIQESSYYYKHYHVFNVGQVNNYNIDQPTLFEEKLSQHLLVDKIIKGTGVDIEFIGKEAYYDLWLDQIKVPPKNLFFDTDYCSAEHAFYSTTIHEIIHWTGYSTRCNRPFFSSFGSPVYAFEELIAEFGAALICTDLKIQIKPRISHAKYLNNWLKVLNDDYRFLPEAISFAINSMEWLYLKSKVKNIGLKKYKPYTLSNELKSMLLGESYNN